MLDNPKGVTQKDRDRIKKIIDKDDKKQFLKFKNSLELPRGDSQTPWEDVTGAIRKKINLNPVQPKYPDEDEDEKEE